MDLKGILKAITLELRRELEGKYDAQGKWQPGDLERRLAATGVRRDRAPVPVDELPHLAPEDQEARRVIDAFVQSRAEAGQSRETAITEFVRDAAYTWANRLLALRCMEARALIDEVILQKDAYGGRSLQHNRLAKKEPERCAGEDEGLFAVLFDEFTRRAEDLPLLFDPRAPEVALRPSLAALKHCVGILSGAVPVKGQVTATDEVFTAPDALGWTYQYWNTEEKDRVFEKVRTKKGSKIEGAEIIPATCIYTEPYMVKFLVQNSLGAIWMDMYPSSRLAEKWEYYVRGLDRVPISKKPVAEVTFLDPACGSGHFLVEAFDLFYEMYLEEGLVEDSAEICASIIERNLYGIDIDERAAQIAALALVMKAKEKAPDFVPRRVNLVATNIRLPANKEHLDAFLRKYPDDTPLRPALVAIFEGLAHADELGSLLEIEEPVEKELRALRARYEASGSPMEQQALWGELQKPVQGKLPIGITSYESWKERALARIREHFDIEARDTDMGTAFFGEAASKGLSLVDLLARRYDVVAANPPYLGKRKLGEVVRRHISKQYKAGSEDLYSAFLQRALSLLGPAGRLSFVTMAGYSYLPPFAHLRSLLLEQSSLEILAFLGPYAFPEMRDHVNALLTIASESRQEHGRVCVIRAEQETEKPVALQAIRLRSSVDLGLFHRLPNNAFADWFDERLLADYSRHEKVSANAVVSLGLSAIDNARFYRRSWELAADHFLAAKSWFLLMKGGQYDKWAGPCHWIVRWRDDGLNWKLLFDKKYPYAEGNYDWKIHDSETYFGRGACYTNASSWGMGARELPAGSLFEDTSPGIFTDVMPPEAVACLLNSRAFHLYAALINPSVHLQPGDVREIPFPIPDPDETDWLARLGRLSMVTKGALLSRELTSWQFAPDALVGVGCATLEDAWRTITSRRLRLETLLAFVDGLSDFLATRAYLSPSSIEILRTLVVTPAAWKPLPSLDSLLPLEEAAGGAASLAEIADIAERSGFVVFCGTSGLGDDDDLLRQYFEGGASVAVEPAEDVGMDGENEADDGGGEEIHGALHMFDQSLVERASRNLSVNPVVFGGAAAVGVETKGWRSQQDLGEYCCDLISYYVLSLLGLGWPSIEGGAPLSEQRKILLINGGTVSKSLLSLVRDRIAADFGASQAHTVERHFQAHVGKALEDWLSRDFFVRHISQFKKRPVAWQIESSPSANRRRKGRQHRSTAAFSCLVHAHYIDIDLFPMVRTHHIGPFITSIRTELDRLEKMTGRTVEQDARRIELEQKLEEIEALDAGMRDVIREGFALAELDVIGAADPLDKWSAHDDTGLVPDSIEAFLMQERRYDPDPNDGIRVNIAPLQRAGLLAADVLTTKDVQKALAHRAQWRADERRWCREGKLPRPGWWPADEAEAQPSAMRPTAKKTSSAEDRT